MSQKSLNFDVERLERQFMEFHEANPEYYKQMVALAREMKSRRTRFGIKAIFEIIRWNSTLRGTGEYKMSNNHAPYYARLIMKNEPDLDGFFQVNELVSRR